MRKQHSLDLTEEQRIWRQGGVLVGVDEVGRGPLAGPVVACAVAIDMSDKKHLQDFLALGVADSKKLTPKKREEISKALMAHPAVRWGIGMADEKTIDSMNILKASLSAMRQAVIMLVSVITKEFPSYEGNSFVYVDGREIIPDLTANQTAVINGDGTVFSIAAASIIAKVARDAMMQECAKKYPAYQFEKHKGYGTKLHFDLIEKHGMSPIHRRSFLKKHAR